MARKSDYDEMDAVFRDSATALCLKHYDEQKVFDWTSQAWPKRFIESAKNGNKQFVKTINGKIICFAELNTKTSTLNSIFVLPSHAGKGIGQEMLEFLFDKAHKNGLTHLKLDASLNAVNFYRRNGFRKCGDSYFTTQNGVVLESVKMERELSS